MFCLNGSARRAPLGLLAALAALAAVLFAATPARAWDQVGHRVVARIAWMHMSPDARAAAVALLLAAPEDSGIPALLPADGRPLTERERELFDAAAFWADRIRDPELPSHRYHQPTWHYVNFFWLQREPGGPATELDLPRSGDLLTQLERVAGALRTDTAAATPSAPPAAAERKGVRAPAAAAPDSATGRAPVRAAAVGRLRAALSAAPAQRALDLAWLLHLVGDLHQPLHSSARVTAADPEGDRGGNAFGLGEHANLHSFWDGVLRERFPREAGEADAAYIGRIADALVRAYPRASFGAELEEPADFEAWARESLAIAQRAYPAYLERGAPPPARYADEVYAAAASRIALAGYRLAGLLEALLGG